MLAAILGHHTYTCTASSEAPLQLLEADEGGKGFPHCDLRTRPDGEIKAAGPESHSFISHMRATLRPPRVVQEKSRPISFRFDGSGHPWLGAVGVTVAVGLAYFLAARFGLTLRTKLEGMAIFWPAAGIAVGALIVLGPGARLPVAVAVAVATITSNLLIARNPGLAIIFGLVNAGQALLTVWLIERRFGNEFKLESVLQVLGFLVATAVGAALAALCAAVAISLVQSAVSTLNVWHLWFASCSLGTVTVAPLLIGLGAVMRAPSPRHEMTEGAVGLATLAVMSVWLTSLRPLGKCLAYSPGVPHSAMGRRTLSASVRGGFSSYCCASRHLVDNLQHWALRRRKHSSCGPHTGRSNYYAGSIILGFGSRRAFR